MEQASILAETQTLTEARGEASDPDRGTPLLTETQSVTEARGESSDPDRGVAFAETQTVTKANGEACDADQAAFGGTVDWQRGERRPLLFRHAVAASGEAPTLGYDEVLDMAVDNEGQSLILSGALSETMTKTAMRNETNDTDR